MRKSKTVSVDILACYLDMARDSYRNIARGLAADPTQKRIADQFERQVSARKREFIEGPTHGLACLAGTAFGAWLFAMFLFVLTGSALASWGAAGCIFALNFWLLTDRFPMQVRGLRYGWDQ